MKTVLRKYKIRSSVNLSVLLLSDLHARSADDAIRIAKEVRPDIITLAGDITETLGKTYHGHDESHDNSQGFRLMRECAKITKTFYALGNHEMRPYPENLQKILDTGIIFLDNSHTFITDRDGKTVCIGGLASGLKEEGILKPTNPPSLEWLNEFKKIDAYKILINHHPEYWAPYIKDSGIGLTVSGHAHGGQVRIFGKGFLAPGQGFFPKYDGGVFYDDNGDALVVGRGLCNTGGIVPRLFNPPEAVLIRLYNEEQTEKRDTI